MYYIISNGVNWRVHKRYYSSGVAANLFLNPVPAGIRRPIMTFSFNPRSLSSLPSTAALINTLEVS